MCKGNVDMRVVKGLAIFINIIVLLLAIYHAVWGYLIFAQLRSYAGIVQVAIHSTPMYGFILFVIAGGIVLYGFIALCMNGFGMLICYCMLLIILGVICFVMGFYTYIDSTEMIRSHYFRTIVDEGENVTVATETMDALERMQSDLQCCGLSKGVHMYNSSAILPKTCCRNSAVDCFVEDIWPDSCIAQLSVYCDVNFQWVYLCEWSFTAYLFTAASVAYLHAIAVKEFFYY